MLKSIDVLIGLSTVMLLASMIVMAITHVLMMIVNARAKHLRTGLAELLRQFDPGLQQQVASRIVDKLLCFPQLRSATGRIGAVVHRDEFVKLLLVLAGPDDGSDGLDEAGHIISLDKSERDALRSLLARNGLPEPEQTLAAIRDLGAQLERRNPELAADIRHRIAILQEAQSRFVSGVHEWFDRTIDRVSERFTAYTRAVTFGVAVLVVLVLQLDAIALVNRLNLDDAARKAFVEQVAPVAAKLQQDANALPASSPQSEQEVTAQIKEQTAQLQKTTNELATNSLVPLPQNWSLWRAQWRTNFSFHMLIGLIVSVILLNLGAPFWYKALSGLLQLRSLAAQKDDTQRAARSGAAPAAAAAGVGSAAPAQSQTPQWVRGEQGDLALIG